MFRILKMSGWRGRTPSFETQTATVSGMGGSWRRGRTTSSGAATSSPGRTGGQSAGPRPLQVDWCALEIGRPRVREGCVLLPRAALLPLAAGPGG